MTDEERFQKIFAEIKKAPHDPEPYRDVLDLSRLTGRHDTNHQMRGLLSQNLATGWDRDYMFEIYRKSLLYDSPVELDAYLQYLEIDRNPQDRFYLPRRKILYRAVQAIQELVDDKLDEMFLSMPPRVGKTTLLMFLCTWLVGRDSERTNLYCAFSDTITKAFYNGVLEVLTDSYTYKWQEIFPNSKIVATNSQEETINLDRKKRYSSLVARSLYGTLNGAVDCNGFLISDDLIGGIEEALNPDRLNAAWAKVDNNMIPRAKESARLLWCGTRWSLADPAGRRMDMLMNNTQFANRRYRIVTLPALDENDESNFDYLYGVGFSTEFYRNRRASFEHNNDMASWNAQYQGQPIERDGALFTPDGMRYYNGELPEGKPDRIFAAVDPAFGGGDFVACPICYQYDEDIYVHDVVYSDAEKDVTQPLLVDAFERHNVGSVQIEANKMVQPYVDRITELIRDKGLRIAVSSRPAPNDRAKEVKIFERAPDIRDHMIFRDSGKRSKEYNLFMQNVFSFKMTGRNKHDDAPDSLAQAIDMVFSKGRRVKVIPRPF